MAFGGVALRFGSTALRFLEFCCAAVALGIFSYFLAALANHDLNIARRWQAVEGMSGAAVLYTIFGVILTVCLGGVTFFGFIAVVLDICFVGCFIAIAILTRDGANSCAGYVQTPLGDGLGDSHGPGYAASLRTACKLNTAVFAVSIIAAVLFFITAFLQIALVRHHKKEKAYGPGPNNNYTSGRRGKFFARKPKTHNTRDAEAATALPAAHGGLVHDQVVRPSGETSTTVGNNAYTTEPKFGQPGYGQATNY